MAGPGHPDTGNGRRPSPSVERVLIYRFAECVLDSRSLELSVRGAIVKLEPKPLELLLFLLRHPGEVVTKDELQDGVWPGRILSESVLTKAVAKLRQGLGDEDQTILKTVHGYGYRLLAPVTLEVAGPAPSAPQLQLAAGDHPPLRPHWQLSERLGSGGLGEVWLATHAKTGERRVFKFALDANGLTALKREITLFRVLKDTHGDRPDLIRLLDWNVDEQPYFIESEYAAGGSLPQWAESKGGLIAVPLDERLELVAQAADALAAAHAAGVLHKDLKPANLLISFDDAGQTRVRLGDFGSGRMMDLARLERLEITRLGFTRAAGEQDDDSSGTPFYFAPELIAGQQPTVQTDLYALGVILYQMIVGDLKRPLTAGWERDVADPLLREDVAAAAAGQVDGRLSDAAELARRLRGRAERAAARHAEREQVAESERLKAKLARLHAARRRLIPLAGVLLIGVIATSLMALRASQARIAAELETAKSEAINRFVNEDLLNAANPLQRPPGAPEVTVRAALATAEQTVDARFADQPAVAASVLTTLGVLRHEFGDYDQALVLLDRAIAKAESAPAERNKARLERASLLISADRDDEAIAALDSLLADQLSDPGTAKSDVLETRLRLLEARSGQGSDPDFLKDLATLRDDANRTLGEPNWIAGEAGGLIASIHRVAGLPERGVDDARRAYAALRTVLGADHPTTLKVQVSLAHSLNALGQKDEAVSALREAFERIKLRFGPTGTDTLHVQNELGFILNMQGRYAEGEAVFADLVARHEQRGNGQSFDITAPLSNLANARLQLGRPAEALPLIERGLAILKALPEPQPARAVILRRLQAESLMALKRNDEAKLALDAGETAASVLPDTDMRRLALYGQRGRWLIASGDPAAGERLLDAAIAGLRKQIKDDHPLLAPLLLARASSGQIQKP
ncbi:tetratricopeptide repeat protein [Nevskia sp.]|uniref:protein kinase domain-containing protein n=1 Tax=Nevskia sp. TaxID=1929292 RepID=UPI0025F7F010|nr:tetratricopeptide repeat protein [Nevskia sp.]